MADKFKVLRKVLAGAVETLIAEEAEKLKKAVEGELNSDPEHERLLLSAGLIKQIRDDSTLRTWEIAYKATPLGVKIYNDIYKI